MSLLYNKLNECTSSLMMPIYSYCSYIIIFIIYILVRFHGQLEISFQLILINLAFTCAIIWTVVLQMGGSIYKQSNACILNWKRINHHYNCHISYRDLKLMRKISASCKPMGLRFGGFYVVRLVRVLKFVHFVVWGTVKTLVVF
jgi:hypothetical protein